MHYNKIYPLPQSILQIVDLESVCEKWKLKQTYMKQDVDFVMNKIEYFIANYESQSSWKTMMKY